VVAAGATHSHCCAGQHEKMSSPAGSGAYPAINGGLDMYVPNHLIARLIGKQGKCVSELQSQSVRSLLCAPPPPFFSLFVAPSLHYLSTSLPWC
jgi:hypothetical protein